MKEIKQRKHHSRRRLRSLFWMLVGIGLTALMLFPFYMLLTYSFMRPTDILRYPPPIFPPEFSFAGYQRAWETLADNLRSSLIYGFGTILVTMLIATPAAYALVKLRSRVGPVFLFCIILAQMAPGIIVANTLYAMFTRAGWLDSYQAVILADSTIAVPFAIIIIRAFMLGIPPELAEAATIDGAGQWLIFWWLYVPLSRTALITAGLFSFLFGWGDFRFALILNSNPHHTPITVGIYRFISSYSVEWPAIMATSLIAAIPAILLLAAAQRYVAAGITAGAVKE